MATIPTAIKKTNVFERNNMLPYIRQWRMDGISYNKIVSLIKEQFGVTVVYSQLYTYCTRNGLDDLSGERKQTVNCYQELLDSLAAIKKSIAVSQVALEETQQQIKEGSFDNKSFASIITANERLEARRESLIKSIVSMQQLVYNYKNISDFMNRIQEIIKDKLGLEAWDILSKELAEDFQLRELLRKIPKEKDVTARTTNVGSRKKKK